MSGGRRQNRRVKDMETKKVIKTGLDDGKMWEKQC